MHTVSEPYIPNGSMKHMKRITVEFEIPSGANPIQATLDYKYLNYGVVEYWFDSQKQKNGSSTWISDEYGIYCDNCETEVEEISKITPYCPYCGKYMKNYTDMKCPSEDDGFDK